MKIAIIDHVLNPGGGARIIRSLLPAMRKIGPELDITFFGNEHGIKRENLQTIAASHKIQIKKLKSTGLSGKDLFKIKGSRLVIALFQNKLNKLCSLLPYYLSGEVYKELETVVRGFDIALFTWPFHLKCPKLDCPMVGIFQDFNYKYYFTSNMFTPWIKQFLNVHTPDLLSHFTPVVTSRFVAEELTRFYPQYASKVQVIPIAPMGEPIGKERSLSAIQKFAIPKKFLLYPTNTSSHKNIGPLLAALPLIKKQGHEICLVLAGDGTENINGRACSVGIEVGTEGRDVFGLGYVSNEEIDALIQHAAVVVNCSLYEGNNGPALDAWAKGTPVAMSHIPPFVELLHTFNVKAATFNPRSPEDIAEKIGTLLTYPETTRNDAIVSQASIQHFTWESCAREYIALFERLLAKRCLSIL